MSRPTRLRFAAWSSLLLFPLAGCGSDSSASTPQPDASVDTATDTGTDADDDASQADAGRDAVEEDGSDACAQHCRNGVVDCGESDVDCGGECVSCADSEATFYVDPELGDDDGDGSRADPFLSVQRARDAVRGLRESEPSLATPVVVALRGGTYWLTETLLFGAQDSGTATSPGVYRAYPGEHPVLSGGRLLEGWQVDSEGAWHLTLPEVVSNNWQFTQLWVDGGRRWRPRLPKENHYFIYRKADPIGNTDGKDNRFGFRQEEVRWDWHNLGDVEVLAWHNWTISRLRIASVDPAARLVTLTGTTRCDRPFCQLAPGRRYLVENVREALTEPGEWYLDSKSGELTYLPNDSETPADTTVVAPMLDRLLVVEGSEAEPVEHLEFDGIEFLHTHWATPPEGYSSPQAEVNLSAAIELEYARNCTFVRSTIANTGAWGLSIGDDSHDNLVEQSIIRDVGAGGIRVGASGHQQDEQRVPSENTLRDNLILQGGRMHPAGVGLLVTHAAHTTAEHNEITDFYYSGISVGWSWGYGASNAHDNEIAFNHVYQIGQGVLSDMAGIYTLGVSPGTHIHHNRFHDIRRNRYGGWGIYFDEGSTDVLAEFNVVYDTQDEPFHLHFGQNDTLVNNLWFAEGSALVRRSRAETHHTMNVDRNVFVSTGSQVQGGVWNDDLYSFDNNLYWSTGQAPLDFGGRTFAEWQAEGQDVNSLVGDPKLADPSQGDYAFGADSPAHTLGIEAIDVSAAGRLTAPHGDDMASAKRAFPAAVGTAPVDIDFEDMVPGQPPTIGECHPGDGSGGLDVTSLTAANGTSRSLAFRDAADNSASFNPHYVVGTDHGEGTYRVSYWVRWEAGASALLEWRDWRTSPYVSGPAIAISADGAVAVQGSALATLPPGEWVRFEVEAGLGTSADGTFDLALSSASLGTQSFSALPCASAGFQYVTWIGFISTSTSATTFYVDEIADDVAGAT